MFTKEHYLKLAQTLNKTIKEIEDISFLESVNRAHYQSLVDEELSTVELVVRRLEEMLIEDNPRFEVAKFEKEVYK
jgi:cell fate (sporulation/competence/biofilm development) regulator YmcA (YheA/YmcA/DUF963 family)